MADLSPQDRLDRMVVEAVSPDASLRLVVRAGPIASVAVTATAYRGHTDAAVLERQLVAVLDQGFTVWATTRMELLAQIRGRRRPGRAEPGRSRIDRDAEQVTVTVAAPGARVRLSATGLTRWRAGIAVDTPARATALEFVEEVNRALATVLSRHDRAIRQLRARHLD